MKYNMIFVAGFYSGNAYLFSLDKNQNIKKSGKNASKNKTSEKLILNYFKKGYITSLEMSQDEKYIVSGNNKGVLVIIELLNNNFSNNTSFSNIENNNNTKLLKMINSHNGHPINYISINSDLNLFGDCSNDNYIHIYTLPRCDKIISLYGRGLTTREINEQIQDLYGIEVSATMVSNITDQIIPEIKEWQERPLDEVYPFVFIDAVHFSVREDNRVVKKAAYIVLGINSEGFKEILGIWIGENESAKYWLGVLNELKQRGVKDILIISNNI